MTRYHLLIFDLDDTLFDYTATERSAVIGACDSVGIGADGDDRYETYRAANRVARGAFPEITPFNVDRFRLERAATFLAMMGASDVAAERFVLAYLEGSTVGVLFSGVAETLRALPSGLVKVVATNGTTYPRLQKLLGSPIAQYFDGFFSAETLNLSKASPEYFLKVIEHYGVSRDRVLIIGDDYQRDILNAVAIGVDSCWVARTRRPHDGLPDSVAVVDDFREVLDIVARR